MTAVLEHMFNNHEHCSPDWCTETQKNDEELDKVEMKCKYLDQESATYHVLKDIHKKCTTNDQLMQCYHEFSSQKNESLNKKISVTAPKDETFSTSMSLVGRTDFVSLRDSIGELKAVQLILAELGFSAIYPVTAEYLKRIDKRLRASIWKHIVRKRK